MNEFPRHINVENKDKFSEYMFDHFIVLLRNDIYNHLITRNNDESNYYEMEKFTKLNKCKISISKLLEKIIPELVNLGWKCKTSFGGTGLFIYSSDKPPHNCYPDEF